MLKGRLSTQIGIIFFVIISSVVGLMSWQRYHEITVTIPLQIEDEVPKGTCS